MQQQQQPVCCILNLSSGSAGWIPASILGQEAAAIHQDNSTDTAGCHGWRVATKYFHADILLQTVNVAALLEEEDSEELQPVIQSTEAVVFYCDSSRESFQLAGRAWERFKEVSPAVCLCVVERTLDVATDDTEMSRAAVLEWCLARQFELVDCEEDVEEDSDHEEVIREKVGRERIAEALRSHTWSNMIMLEEAPRVPPLAPASGPRESCRDPEAPSLTAAKIDPGSLEKETESFESLFCQLSVMKEQSARLPPADRKLYAEKMALAFYAAMGVDDELSSDDE